MKNKVPRKLKKELKKVECLSTSQPSIKMSPNPFSPVKMIFTQYTGVKFKKGVVKNKWTRLLERNIIRENKRTIHKHMENAFKRQSEYWAERYTVDDLKSKLKDFSEEQFRREYLCEPEIKSLPSIVEFQNGERLEWQPSSQREVEEYIKRCNLQPYIQEPDGNGIAILKLPSLSPEQFKKFIDEWQKFVNTSQPITSVDPEASIEFIPSKRPHRLHNHPRLEIQNRLNDNEVIVDKEFVHMFSNAFPLSYDLEHWVVNKDEFINLSK